MTEAENRAADQAAAWLTLLMADDASDADRQRWRAWHEADPEHQRAWRQIEAACARLRGLHGGAAYRALSTIDKERAPGRRRSLAVMLAFGAAGSGALLATRTGTFQQLAADLRTGVGERREWTLDDGTRVLLNTDSALNIAYDARERRLQLVAGEIRVMTGHAPSSHGRPLLVACAHGVVHALGTAFTLRQRDGCAEVAVQEGAVAIAAGLAPPPVVHAGHRTSFSRRGVAHPEPDPGLGHAWTGGHLVADAMRLGDFLAELARYRRGVVRCEPALANLPISGVFPLADTDRILAALPATLPVRIRRHHAWWVAVEKK